MSKTRAGVCKFVFGKKKKQAYFLFCCKTKGYYIRPGMEQVQKTKKINKTPKKVKRKLFFCPQHFVKGQISFTGDFVAY